MIDQKVGACHTRSSLSLHLKHVRIEKAELACLEAVSSPDSIVLGVDMA